MGNMTHSYTFIKSLRPLNQDNRAESEEQKLEGSLGALQLSRQEMVVALPQKWRR